MENFWNKLGYLCIGLALGSICGLCSTYHLELCGAMWRPPALFCVFFTILWGVYWRQDFAKLLLILGLFWVIYWIALFGGQIYSGMMTLGAVLSFVVIHRLLSLKTSSFLKIAVFILLAFGLVVDFWIISGAPIPQDWGLEIQHRFPDDVGMATDAAIFIWQTIALGAITLQLYTEKRYRQNLVAQEHADRRGKEIHDSSIASNQ